MKGLVASIGRAMRPGHPHTRRPAVVFLARSSLWKLLVALITAVMVGSAVGAAVLVAAGSSSATFFDTTEDIFLAIINANGLNRFYGSDGANRVVTFTVGLIAFLLPPLFLGVVVFKFFTIDPIQFRSKISLTLYFGSPVLAARFYNRLPVELYDLSIRAYLRLPSANLDTPSLQNRPLDLRRPGSPDASSLTEDTDEITWPVALRNVPFMLRIPLRDERFRLPVSSESRLPQTMTVQGYDFDTSLAEILIYIEGEIPQIGESFTSFYRYRLGAEGEVGRPAQIDVNYLEPPKRWQGWSTFDETEELFVFGYGSLASRASVERFLDRRLHDTEFVPARLVGHRRCWNVAMNNSLDVPGYKSYTDVDGGRPDIFVGFVGIEPANGAEVNGVLIHVSDDELRRLEHRERNYTSIDVSQGVHTDHELPARCRLVTFNPRAEARQRADAARDAGTLYATESYVQMVEEAFRSLGPDQLRAYRSSTDNPPRVMKLSRQDVPFADIATDLAIEQGGLASMDIAGHEKGRSEAAARRTQIGGVLLGVAGALLASMLTAVLSRRTR